MKKITIIFLALFFAFGANARVFAQKSPKVIVTKNDCSLYDKPNGKGIVWSAKGNRFEVIRQQGDWYLLSTSFGKITQAWINKKDVTEALTDSVDLNKWRRVPALIHDKVGDVDNRDSCDIKTVKLLSKNNKMMFLIELAVGWHELFLLTRATSAVGALLLDVDNNADTGFDGGMIHVKRDGTEERRVDFKDPRRGAEYKIQVNTGFRMQVTSDGTSRKVPIVSYALYRWNSSKLRWVRVDKNEAVFKEAFIEFAVPQRQLIGIGGKLRIILDEWNSSGSNRYSSAYAF